MSVARGTTRLDELALTEHAFITRSFSIVTFLEDSTQLALTHLWSSSESEINIITG